ncbi:hypothetical protein CEXT_733811 [Caerostris extrusa]|uniref:Uncharacterized protein n=1 Tax=Caerostris extrusa TaxID=172846 RepID=A0AAV4XZT9_CAEEX|nr:hypothetical protein CEXT_733811 [Caerostris extrusa]
MTVCSALNSSQAHNQDAASKRNPFIRSTNAVETISFTKEMRPSDRAISACISAAIFGNKDSFSVDSWWMHCDSEEKRGILYFFYVNAKQKFVQKGLGWFLKDYFINFLFCNESRFLSIKAHLSMLGFFYLF